MEIVSAMRAIAAPGLARPDNSALKELHTLTQSLLAARLRTARQEYARFLEIGRRRLVAPKAELEPWLGRKTVMVTGGTGCIGSTLMALLEPLGVYRLVSYSRGLIRRWPQLSGAEYLWGDIRDRRRLDAVIREVKPDVVFHTAAQRDPIQAEIEVLHTVSTNVFGTRNILMAASNHDVSQVVIASTGKALRPYSPDVYAASKRAAEWLGSCSSGWNTRCSAARFTHVVDNSIVHRRLLNWCQGGVIRLHSADILFYAQSAAESAALMLRAGLEAQQGEFSIHAITDLGFPVNLLDIALGILAQTGSSAPIYFSGYERGFEPMPFPGLYDPATAGDLSPLVSAFEAEVCGGRRIALQRTFHSRSSTIQNR